MPLRDIDLGSAAFWALDDDVRDGAFATLRREAPVSFHREPETMGFPVGPGHWALTRFDDVSYVSRHPEIFSSRPNSTTISDPTAEAGRYLTSMITQDDPEHARLRALVHRAFTPRFLARIEESIRDRARDLVAAMVANHADGHCDLVEELAGPLPTQIICDMIGIPEELHHKVFQWTNVIMGGNDPDVTSGPEDFVQAMTEFGEYGVALAEDRRKRPCDDLATNLVQAEDDGRRLTSADIASFFIVLGAAGNETTRNAISHGVVTLSRFPDERQKWWADFDGYARSAVEEIVRWSTPVMFMRRTLTRDAEVGGTKMRAGDKVSMWYNSANRDEAKFADPWRFDVARIPNPQLGYGAGGVHFCLGANLARREITAVFDELHKQIPDIVAVGEPAILRSPWMHGVKRLPVGWTRSTR